MSNINTLSKRVEKLENREHKPAHNIKIIYKFNKWHVMKDREEFDTLWDAIDHVRMNYSTANVKIAEVEKAYPTMHFEIVIEDSYKELKA